MFSLLYTFCLHVYLINVHIFDYLESRLSGLFIKVPTSLDNRDTQSDPDFSIVARVEAFIAGWGLDEALKRSEAYLNAGADAILMHSKKSDPSDIESFVKAWNNQGPVVIVPTKYYTVPTDLFREWGISLVIWANHNLRASISAMQDVTQQIYKDQSLVNVEKKVAAVKEVFRLQKDDELKEAEKKYLPQK